MKIWKNENLEKWKFKNGNFNMEIQKSGTLEYWKLGILETQKK